MAKKKDSLQGNAVFTANGHLSDKTPFKIGDKVPSDIDQSDLDALREMNAILEENEGEK